MGSYEISDVQLCITGTCIYLYINSTNLKIPLNNGCSPHIDVLLVFH